MDKLTDAGSFPVPSGLVNRAQNLSEDMTTAINVELSTKDLIII
jgi:hypothetical protein